MITRRPEDNSSWELTPEPPYGYPDLESVIDHAKIGYLTPRNRPDESLAISIRNLPPDVWDTVFFIKEEFAGVETMSFAEGCLIHSGLSVLEQMLKHSPREKKARLEAIRVNDMNGRYRYIGRNYQPIHLGVIKVNTVTVFCLSEADRSRVVEIAHTYGLTLGLVTTLTMIGGMAQSTSIVPEHFRKRAQAELARFKDWLED